MGLAVKVGTKGFKSGYRLLRDFGLGFHAVCPTPGGWLATLHSLPCFLRNATCSVRRVYGANHPIYILHTPSYTMLPGSLHVQ